MLFLSSLTLSPEGSTEPRFGEPETKEIEAPKPENEGRLGPFIQELRRIFSEPRIMEGADYWVRDFLKPLSDEELDLLAADDCIKKVIARVALWDHGYRVGGVDKTRIPFMMSLVARRKKNMEQHFPRLQEPMPIQQQAEEYWQMLAVENFSRDKFRCLMHSQAITANAELLNEIKNTANGKIGNQIANFDAIMNAKR